MMFEMPVVIQPHEIEGFPDPKVSCAAGDMSLRAVMMHILYRRPNQAKARIHRDVIRQMEYRPPIQCSRAGEWRLRIPTGSFTGTVD